MGTFDWFGNIPIQVESSDVEFEPKFDTIKPDKPYSLNYYEWLAIKGDVKTLYFSTATTQSVPSGKVWFVLGWNYFIECNGGLAGLSDWRLYTTQTTFNFFRTTNIGAGNTDRITSSQEYVIPIRVDDQITAIKLGGSNSYLSCMVTIIEIDKEFLKEN